MNLNDYADEIHGQAEASGFWPPEGRNFGEMIALMHSELSEALEAHRNGQQNHFHEFKIPHPEQPLPEYVRQPMRRLAENIEHAARTGEPTHPIPELDRQDLTRAGLIKPEGVAVELADALIRILDTMHSLGVDIDAIVQEKMSYNASRSFKHGKSY